MKKATLAVLITATALGALVGGVSANRLIVVDRAWSETGSAAWAEYTRIADLGRGRRWYPAVGLSALACCLAAAALYRSDGARVPRAALPVYGAAVLAVAALFVTVARVVPATLAIADPAAPASQIAASMAAASRWWTVKAILHVLTLGANVSAVARGCAATGGRVTAHRIRGLLAGAALLGGLLAGGDVDRTFIQMPAWRSIGPASWAAFSRHADLGNGFAWYPLEAIGATALLGAAAAGLWRRGPVRVAAPTYIALVLALAGLALTTQAAPQMLSIRGMSNADTPALRRAFDVFEWWGNLRGFAQTAAFAASLWALIAVSRDPANLHPEH